MTDMDVQAAIKEAMQTEKAAMDFYKYGAEKLSDEKGRKTFELLAREEKQHAKMFFDIYKGSDIPSFDAFIDAPPDTESSWWKELQKLLMAEFDERRALQLAIEQEDALAQQLFATAETISDPEVKAVYLANAKSTQNHSDLIGEDLHDIFG